MTIYSFIAGILVIVLIGIPLLFALGVFALITMILGSIKAYGGEVYSYPLTIKFLK